MNDDKRKILIIDDEEVVLDSCTQILGGGDHELATANNGARRNPRARRVSCSCHRANAGGSSSFAPAASPTTR